MIPRATYLKYRKSFSIINYNFLDRAARHLRGTRPARSENPAAVLDACLARHPHACHGGAHTGHGKQEGEGAEERPDNAECGSSDGDEGGRAEGKREKQEEASKRGPPSSEATVRTRRGIASHTGPSAGTGPRLNRDRNN